MLRDVQRGLFDDVLIEDSQDFFGAFGDDVATYARTHIAHDVELSDDFEHPTEDLLKKIYLTGKRDLNMCRRREKQDDFSDCEIYHEFKENRHFRTGFVLQAMSAYIINRERY